MSRLLFVPLAIAALLLALPVTAAEDCTPVPYCGGEPQCATAQDCESRAWPLACAREAGWWQCCNGLQKIEACCVPHCPEQETENGNGGDEDQPSGGGDDGGCAAAGGTLTVLGAALLGLALVFRSRRRAR